MKPRISFFNPNTSWKPDDTLIEKSASSSSPKIEKLIESESKQIPIPDDTVKYLDESDDSSNLSDEIRTRKRNFKKHFMEYIGGNEDKSLNLSKKKVVYNPIHTDIAIPLAQKTFINDFTQDGKIIVRKKEQIHKDQPHFELSSFFQKHQAKMSLSQVNLTEKDITISEPEKIICHDVNSTIDSDIEMVKPFDNTNENEYIISEPAILSEAPIHSEPAIISQPTIISKPSTIHNSFEPEKIPQIIKISDQKQEITYQEPIYEFSCPVLLPQYTGFGTGEIYFYFFRQPIPTYKFEFTDDSQCNIVYRFSKPISII